MLFPAKLLHARQPLAIEKESAGLDTITVQEHEQLRIRNLISSALFILVLASALALLAIKMSGTAIPNWIINDTTRYLNGTSPASAQMPDADWNAFLQGAFQKDAESMIEACIPFQDLALLGFSSLQRQFIASSNSIYSFDCYPARYGNDTIYIPSVDALAQTAIPAQGLLTSLIPSFGHALSTFAASHPDMQFYICLADAEPYSQANPSNRLVSNSVTTSECMVALRDSLDPTMTNIHIAAQTYTDTDDYYQHYYTSDHHWNGFGATDAYTQIVETPPLQPNSSLDSTASSVSFPGMVMNGSQSRNALFLLNEPLCEPVWDLGKIELIKGTQPIILDGSNQRSALLSKGLASEFNFYHTYYGPSSYAKIINEESMTADNAVIIGDSFTSAIQWLIATDHHQTQTFLDAWDQSATDGCLEDRVEQSGSKTVYFIGSPNAIGNIMKKPSDYLEMRSR